MATTAPTFATPFIHLAAYQFGELRELRSLRSQFKEKCDAWHLKGTILLSPEGINLFVAGVPERVRDLLEEIRRLPGFSEFSGKYNPCEHQPYNRMLVRLKKEIIAFGVAGIQPADYTSKKIRPLELKQWLDEGRPVTLLDTRNDYEIKLGTFRNALPIGVQKFRDFPDAVRALPGTMKQQPIVMFCTGGIRCEKAGPFMEREGFEEAYQLEGGILKYFEDCADAHYVGECFVFDQRTGVDPSLEESGSTTCHRCQSPLTAGEQADPRFVPGKSCPYCHCPPEQERAAALAARQAKLDALVAVLPGSQPFDNFRPMTVPGGCEGMTLFPFLTRLLPHVALEEWVRLWENGQLVNDDHQVIPLDQPLSAPPRRRVVARAARHRRTGSVRAGETAA